MDKAPAPMNDVMVEWLTTILGRAPGNREPRPQLTLSTLSLVENQILRYAARAAWPA
jgi:hypothetical protein